MAASLKSLSVMSDKFSLLLRYRIGILCKKNILASAPLTPVVVHHMQVREKNIFSTLNAEHLWKSVMAVSNAGRKRGRGKAAGRRKVTDLNKGQVLGTGKANILWPGLNTPIMRGKDIVKQRQLPPDPQREQQLIKIRDEASRVTHKALPPLVRGWSGKKFPGQSVGPPDPVGDYIFEGFDTKVLEFKMVANMTGTLGRKQRFSAFVVVGNKCSLAGYGLGKSMTGKSAIRVAKNRAAKNLMYIPRYDDHTVFHNMYSKFFATEIFIHKKQKGYGLVCHRALRTICEIIGVKDLHCKVEGATKNIQNMTKAFFNALTTQEVHQDLADRTNLHVVEFRPECEMLPTVVASPSSGIVKTENPVDESEDLETDFSRHYYGGRLEYRPPKKLPFYHAFDGYKKRKAADDARRNQPKCQVLRLANLW